MHRGEAKAVACMHAYAYRPRERDEILGGTPPTAERGRGGEKRISRPFFGSRGVRACLSRSLAACPCATLQASASAHVSSVWHPRRSLSSFSGVCLRTVHHLWRHLQALPHRAPLRRSVALAWIGGTGEETVRSRRRRGSTPVQAHHCYTRLRGQAWLMSPVKAPPPWCTVRNGTQRQGRAVSTVLLSRHHSWRMQRGQ